MSLSERIKKQREAAGLTISGAAERAGMHRVAWSELEAGRNTNPTINTLQKIATALNCPVQSLLDRAGDMTTRHLVTDWRSDSVERAFSKALSLARENQCDLILWPPSLSQLENGYLREGIGADLSTELLETGQVAFENVRIHVVTERQHGRVEDVVLAVFPEGETLDDVDDVASHCPAIVVVPRPVTEGLDAAAGLWLRAWDAEVLDGDQPETTPLFQDPVAECAVHKLADPAYDMARPRDREAAAELIGLVRHGGHPIDPDSVKALLLREGRRAADANALREVARGPDAGRPQQAHSNCWAPDILDQLRATANYLDPEGDVV